MLKTGCATNWIETATLGMVEAADQACQACVMVEGSTPATRITLAFRGEVLARCRSVQTEEGLCGVRDLANSWRDKQRVYGANGMERWSVGGSRAKLEDFQKAAWQLLVTALGVLGSKC